MRRIGLFGGKFNPVHLGHLIAAQAALDTLPLDQIIFVPVGTPALSEHPELASGVDRIEMLRLAIEDNPRFDVSDLEVLRSGKSTTLDTVRAFLSQNSNVELTFLLGTDVLDRLHLWHGIEELRRLCRFAVLVRADHDRPTIEPDLVRVFVPPTELSSTQVRANCLQRHAPIDSMVPPRVATYIAAHDLYGPAKLLQRLEQGLANTKPRIVACSGGVDSMLLATIAHRLAPGATAIAHAIGPAVPEEASDRVKAWAWQEDWKLELIETREFADERYLANPVNRCYFCKSHLYESLKSIAEHMSGRATLLSGANTDDLGEYRPGLNAAAEFGVQHPFIEAGINKLGIRALARHLALPFADIPAAPCLASRIYTGTPVTVGRLRAVEAAERWIRSRTGATVVRCRIKNDQMLIETKAEERQLISDSVLAAILHVVQRKDHTIRAALLDPEPYRPGRAFVGKSQ